MQAICNQFRENAGRLQRAAAGERTFSSVRGPGIRREHQTLYGNDADRSFQHIRFVAARGDADIVLGGRDAEGQQKLAAELRGRDGVKVILLPLDI
jgi:hypothetical protein